MKSLVVVSTCDDDQAPDFGKEEREKTKWAQGKGDIHRAILFLVIETL
jgi:hypothetical protein